MAVVGVRVGERECQAFAESLEGCLLVIITQGWALVEWWNEGSSREGYVVNGGDGRRVPIDQGVYDRTRWLQTK